MESTPVASRTWLVTPSPVIPPARAIDAAIWASRRGEISAKFSPKCDATR